MRHHLGPVAAGAAAFLVVLVARLPARLAAFALPRGSACVQLAGTVWSGTCSGLVAAGTPVGDVTWTLHPMRLLAGRLSLDVAVSRPAAAARGRVEISPAGSVLAQNVHADFPLDRGLFAQLPPSTHGSAQVDLASLQWNGKRITEIRGQIEVRGLTADRGEPLGDYRLIFPGGPGGQPAGRVSDLGGPFALQGTVRLTSDPGYSVDGLIAARPSAPPDLAAQLAYLGTPDAQGRRPFSIAGTF